MKSVDFLQINSCPRCFAQTPFSTMFTHKATFSRINNKSIAVAPGNAPSLAVVIVTGVVRGHVLSGECFKLCAILTRVDGERNL